MYAQATGSFLLDELWNFRGGVGGFVKRAAMITNGHGEAARGNCEVYFYAVARLTAIRVLDYIAAGLVNGQLDRFYRVIRKPGVLRMSGHKMPHLAQMPQFARDGQCVSGGAHLVALIIPAPRELRHWCRKALRLRLR